MPKPGRTTPDDNNDGGRGDYVTMAAGGKVAGALLRGLTNAPGPFGDVSRLVGDLVKHRRGKKVGAASSSMQRMTPKKMQPGPRTPITGATSSEQARKQVKPNKAGAQTAGAKRAIYAGLQKDLENP